MITDSRERKYIWRTYGRNHETRVYKNYLASLRPLACLTDQISHILNTKPETS